ncbi:hypothetical protein [Ancylobacter sp.]|uniref:hypothetical protein n=1 Tax=Ancylobacter sp. TaxID=1872567 RepID=UPI003D149594
MIDKREPSIDSPQARPGDEAAAAAAPAPRPPAAAPPSPAARAKGPPQDPVAFQRWLGIEQLKVDMRRLELENKRAEAAPARAAHPALAVLHGVVLVGLLAVVAFLAAQTLNLREEISTLRAAQGQIVERLDALEKPALETPAPAPQAAAPAGADAQTQAQAAPPAAASPAPAGGDALVPLAGTAPTAEAEPAAAALPGTGYTVRIFAPINTVPRAKIDNFTNALKAVGFDVVVSDTGVVQTTSNTLSYHAGSADMANEVAEIIQKRRPALGVELRVSPSIPDNARQVLILNLTEDAFN